MAKNDSNGSPILLFNSSLREFKKQLATVFLITFLFISLSILTVQKEPSSHFAKAVFPPLAKRRSSNPCRDVFEIHSPNTTLHSYMGKQAFEILIGAKNQRTFIFEEFYSVLGREELEEASVKDVITGKKKFEGYLDKYNWKLPYMPCRLKRYLAPDVQTCIKKRHDAGLKTHISYMGDSRIRQQMEILLDILSPFDLNITTSRGDKISLDDFLGMKGNSEWVKFKDHLNVSSNELQDFLITFSWAPMLHLGKEPDHIDQRYMPNGRDKVKVLTGAMDDLTSLIEGPDEKIPEIILLDYGAWGLQSKMNALDNIDISALAGIEKLYPLLEVLSKKTEVVIMLPEPLKEFVFGSYIKADNYFTIQDNKNLEWYLNSQAQLPPMVQLWDTFLPVAHRAVANCEILLAKDYNISQMPPYSRFDSNGSFGCFERVHLGYHTIYVGAQMLLNHLCNKFIAKEEKVCCAK